MDQIQAAYNWVQQAAAEGQQDLSDWQQWMQDNYDSLTDTGKQAADSALRIQTEIAQKSSAVLGTANSVMSVGQPQAGGLQGCRTRRLGALPLIAVAAVIAVIAAIAGFGFYQWRLGKQADADAQKATARSQVQQKALSLVPQLIAAGWTPDQIRKYLSDQNPSPSFMSQIPWGTLALATAAVFVAKSIFD